MDDDEDDDNEDVDDEDDHEHDDEDDDNDQCRRTSIAMQILPASQTPPISFFVCFVNLSALLYFLCYALSIHPILLSFAAAASAMCFAAILCVLAQFSPHSI